MIDILEKAARQAGEILLKYFHKNLVIHSKTSHQDFYTKADISSQEIIKKIITTELINKGVKKTDIGFIGEENLYQGSRKHLFIIDPLDGTSNFSSGLDIFAVSIAYCLQNQILSGVIYRPSNNDLYTVKKNHGAYKNGKKLMIIEKPIKECLFDSVISSKLNIYPKLFKISQKLFPHTKGLRSFFCMTLSSSFLAENSLNILINGNTYLWDIAVSQLLVEESGGFFGDFQGKPIKPYLIDYKKPYQVIACHPKLISKILQHL